MSVEWALVIGTYVQFHRTLELIEMLGLIKNKLTDGLLEDQLYFAWFSEHVSRVTENQRTYRKIEFSNKHVLWQIYDHLLNHM